jgi:hypothetical protein
VDNLEKQRAEVDQAAAWLVDSLPPLWHNLYKQCRKEGFTELQAFELVKTYILAQATNGVNGT